MTTRKDDVSKHEQIVNHILGKIKTGEYEPDDQLPSERALARQFDTSRSTAAKALDRLEEQGHIVRVQGSGSFVAIPPDDVPEGWTGRVFRLALYMPPDEMERFIRWWKTNHSDVVVSPWELSQVSSQVGLRIW